VWVVLKGCTTGNSL